MIEFKTPQLSDREWAAPLMAAEGCMASHCNFANLYLWSRAFCQKITRCGDRLLLEFCKGFAYPAGTGPLAPALEALKARAAAQGLPLILVGVTPCQREKLEAEFPGRFVFEEDRDSWDYVYDINRLADLGGKKLHAKRNHIHRFDDRFPDWMFEPITRENVAECLALENEWAAARHGDEEGADTLHEETVAVIEALYQMEALQMEGGLIRAEGKPIAFSLGSFTTPECFDVHFEKAYGDIQGAYTVINREMARMIRANHPEVKWLNREDDLGLEGLRKAKLSYYPDILLEKFVAREVN
ncbi:MAG: DUF2156 domain-containing protein [Oscillospiraceae bacterium]|nr:DUF2156 domain-containing protein [Oscillospiraceae bacterium]